MTSAVKYLTSNIKLTRKPSHTTRGDWRNGDDLFNPLRADERRGTLLVSPDSLAIGQPVSELIMVLFYLLTCHLMHT